MSEWNVPAAPQRKRPVWPWALGVVGLLLLLALCIGLVNGTAEGEQDRARAAAAGTTAAVGTTAAPKATTAAPVALKAADVQLTVKITDKACFGSAGCNVDYSIRLATRGGVKLPDSCEITYEVTGLDDPQIGTLVLTADGKYKQDEWQSGQTPRSSSKLAAKITDVECS